MIKQLNRYKHTFRSKTIEHPANEDLEPFSYSFGEYSHTLIMGFLS
jgi:hypothetical protein